MGDEVELTAEQGAMIDGLVTKRLQTAIDTELPKIVEEAVKSLKPGGENAAAIPEALKGFTSGNAENGAMKGAPQFFIKNQAYNPYSPYTDDLRGLAFARMARMKAAAVIEQRSLESISGDWRKGVDGRFADHVETCLQAHMTKSGMNGSNVSDGGALLRTTYGEFIELLRATAVVRQSGVRALPLVGGSVTMRRQRSAGQAHYVGEKPVGNKTSKQSYGLEQISPAKLMATTVLSNDLMRDAGPEADVLTRDDLLTVAGLRESLAFLRDNGMENKPRGILHWTESSNKFNANATVNLDNVTADLEKARYLIQISDVPMVGLVWYISPRTESYLRRLRDGNGNLVFKPELDQGKLLGYPVFVTSQIPENLGGTNNATEIYLVATQQHIIFDTPTFEIDAYRGAAYVGANGVEAGLSNDETVIQLIQRHNFFQRHPTGAAVIEAVKWGV